MIDRASAYAILEEGAFASRAGALLQRGFMALTVASSAALIVLIDGSGPPALRALAYLVEALALACFVAEYAARLWTAAEDPRHRGLPPGAARLRHVLSGPSLVDLAVILLMAAHLAGLPHAAAWGALSLLRLLKLARYYLTLRSIADTLAASRQILWASLVIVAATGVIFGCVIFLAERQGQPEVFGSLGASIWWAVATLAGSAKADDAPESPLGQAVAMALNLFGFMIVALPMGIISGIFYAKSQERQFVVTLSMVARVPFFQVLEPARIAQIIDKLRAESYAAGQTIIRKGEIGDRMFFVLSGEAAVEGPSGPIRLAAGEFFGERALVRNEPRSATVKAATAVKTLALTVADLQALLDDHPELMTALTEAIERRASKPGQLA